MSLPACAAQFLRSIRLDREAVRDFDRYPFSIPAVRHLDHIDFHAEVTFLIGENGSGKSTLLEALAIALGLNPEGGSRNHDFATRPSESDLWGHLRLVRGTERPSDLFFLRGESYFNVSTEFDELLELSLDERQRRNYLAYYGGKPPHEQSHGEAFFGLLRNRFFGNGLYLLDEPEAALSPTRQMAFLTLLDELTRERRSQFVIATHSPIVLAFPRARILQLDADGVTELAYEDTEHFRVARDFLTDHRRFVRALVEDRPPGP